MSAHSGINPEAISRTRKERFLLGLSEDDFRDRVVRPLFLRQGLQDGRDLCGPEEEGKDALFVALTPLGLRDVYVVQTKKGSLSMAGSATKNVVAAITQLRTALQTRFAFADTKHKELPAKAILCASGKINSSARKHIVDEVGTPQLVFLDADSLIPSIDQHYPEFWLGIDADAAPYFRNLKKAIEEASEALALSDILATSGYDGNAALDDAYVQLFLYRPVLKTRKVSGQIIRDVDFVRLPATSIPNLKERRLLVLGEAGSGKSTALRRLAYQLAEKATAGEPNAQIPILLRARDVDASGGAGLIALASRTASSIAGTPGSVFGTADLTAGRVILLIDALDEIPTDDGRDKLVTLLNEFHAEYPACTVVLTSRESSFAEGNPKLAPFVPLRLSAIDLSQARSIIARVGKGKKLPPEMAQELLRRLQEVHGFELNPLLVTVFVATTDYARRDIPANITELFKKFTELMLGRWDATKGLAKQFHAPLKDFLLQRVAFQMHEKRATSIPVLEFKSTVANEIGLRGLHIDPVELCDEILLRSGLLRVIGDNLEFRHHLVQEFFAGRGVPEERIGPFALDEWWQRPLVFYFGEHPDKSTLLASIREHIGAGQVQQSFVGAVTVGLALQACYLVPVAQKLDILRWVIEQLANAGMTIDGGEWGKASLPLFKFLTYYLIGRDAVSADVLKGDGASALAADLARAQVPEAQRDLRHYWLLVGLIETGQLEQAEPLIKAFRPKDSRLLLGLHLGCHLTAQYRVTSKEQKRLAQRISAELGPLVDHLRNQVLEEWRTELLEFQRGEVKALEGKADPDPAESPSGRGN